MAIDIAAHKNWLEKLVQDKIASTDLDPEPLNLKLRHTFAVYQNACSIAANFQPDVAMPVFLAALYHDLARFDQYLRFQTFKDAQSFNHGLEGVRLLKKSGRLRDLSRRQRSMAYAAVGLHNRAALPSCLPEQTRIVCEVIRDADKLDILAVMNAHLSSRKTCNPTIVLGLPDNSLPGSRRLLEKAMANEVGSYADLENVNDFRLLLGSWFMDLHSDTARNIFIEQGHGKRLVQGLPDNEHYGAARKKLLGMYAAYENA